MPLSGSARSESHRYHPISCVLLTSLVINSYEDLIEKKRADPKLGLIYRYFTESEIITAKNDHMSLGRSQAFIVLHGILFYICHVKHREVLVAIPDALRLSLLRDFYDNPMAGQMGCRKTFTECLACYVPNLFKFSY